MPFLALYNDRSLESMNRNITMRRESKTLTVNVNKYFTFIFCFDFFPKDIFVFNFILSEVLSNACSFRSYKIPKNFMKEKRADMTEQNFHSVNKM